jgi:hypothetical protein
VEASDSLTLWGMVARVFNTNGTIVITDPATRNFQQRFYRAMLVP